MDVCVQPLMEEVLHRGEALLLSVSSSNLPLNVSDVNYKMEIHIFKNIWMWV